MKVPNRWFTDLPHEIQPWAIKFFEGSPASRSDESIEHVALELLNRGGYAFDHPAIDDAMRLAVIWNRHWLTVVLPQVCLICSRKWGTPIEDDVLSSYHLVVCVDCRVEVPTL